MTGKKGHNNSTQARNSQTTTSQQHKLTTNRKKTETTQHTTHVLLSTDVEKRNKRTTHIPETSTGRPQRPGSLAFRLARNPGAAWGHHGVRVSILVAAVGLRQKLGVLHVVLGIFRIWLHRWVWLKNFESWAYAGFSLWFHIPRGHYGTCF